MYCLSIHVMEKLDMRLDRFLCEMNIGTRNQVKSFVRQGLVTVNGAAVKSADRRIEEERDKICFRGNDLKYRKFYYYMLNKPEGVVSATRDNTDRTVVELLGGCPADISPVGRLDKDTTGLLILTNDGGLAHTLLSPKKHVDKAYRVTVEHPLSEADLDRLRTGIDIGEERPALPAQVSVLNQSEILLTIHEGKYHQVKRMLQAVGNRVLALRRVSFGGLSLDESLKPGEYRELTQEEVDVLRAACGAGGVSG